MSRFLIATMPAAGHVYPAVPVATALVERGHEVVWHTGPGYAETAEQTGAKFVAARRTPSFTDLPAEPDPGAHGAAAGVSALRKLLVERMAGQLADYEEILSWYRPDAILVDLCALGGRALHERHGIVWATLGISPLTMMSPETPSFGTGRPLPRGVTLFDHMISPMLHLQAATPLIEYPRRPWPANVHLVGPLLPDPPAKADLPDWWEELRDARTVVHVTQGTVATDPTTLTLPTLEALADLDGLVVVTTPDPAALRSVPSNVRVAGFVPHALLLPRVDVMVTNGGYNGTKMALSHGVPLVFAPWGNDQPDVAGRVSWAGAGIKLRVRTPKPAAIAAAVREVLTNPSYAEAARRIAAQFREYGSGGRAATLLERLAGTVQPTR